MKMTDTEKLFCEINKLKEYPPEWKMKKVCGEIKGFSFFPGGKGTFFNSYESSDKSEKISDKDYMILGNDWSTLKNYIIDIDPNRLEPDKNIHTDKTGINIMELLKQADIKPEKCFFTNAILGVRTKAGSTDKPPAFEKGNEEFLSYCREFFKFQLSIQRPKAIFVLGKYPAKFLAPLNKKLNVWKNFPNFKTIDDKGKQIIKNVQILPDLSVNFVLLMHPSCRKYNLDKREYKGKTGNNAQIKMIKEVMKK